MSLLNLPSVSYNKENVALVDPHKVGYIIRGQVCMVGSFLTNQYPMHHGFQAWTQNSVCGCTYESLVKYTN